MFRATALTGRASLVIIQGLSLALTHFFENIVAHILRSLNTFVTVDLVIPLRKVNLKK